MASVLLIDDEVDFADCLREELEAYGHRVECLARAQDGPDRLAAGRFDLVLLDNVMPGMTGLEFLPALRERGVRIPVVLMTGDSTADTAIRAINLGAFDYVIKPGDVRVLARELQPVIETALEIGRPAKEVLPGDRPGSSAGLVLHGKSKPMLDVLKRIGHFTDSSDPVLILGETGTGKELVARALHSNSRRKDKPFVALNCTAINETLLESELFGHEKGAFTGADKLRKGKIEYADGGTLFLDEIGDMPLHLQARLLRVLEYQEVERLGSNEPIKVNVRLLSATHHDVEALVEEGKFRRDLFFRLNRVTLRLPPLRERLDDLPELVAYFLNRRAEADGRSRPSVSPAALDRLRAHHWPGNVRELQNVICAAFGYCGYGPELLPGHIERAFSITASKADGPGTPAEDQVTAALRRAVEAAWDTNPKEGLLRHLTTLLEAELTRTALERLGDNQSRVAEKLGVVWNTASKLIKTHGPK